MAKRADLERQRARLQVRAEIAKRQDGVRKARENISMLRAKLRTMRGRSK